MKYRIKLRVQDQGGNERKYSLNLPEGEPLTLGPDTPGIPLSSESLQSIHCVLLVEGGALAALNPLGSERVLVNQKPVTRSPLRHGDLLTLGGYAIEVLELPEVVASEAEAAKTQFIDLAALKPGATVPVESPTPLEVSVPAPEAPPAEVAVYSPPPTYETPAPVETASQPAESASEKVIPATRLKTFAREAWKSREVRYGTLGGAIAFVVVAGILVVFRGGGSESAPTGEVQNREVASAEPTAPVVDFHVINEKLADAGSIRPIAPPPAPAAAPEPEPVVRNNGPADQLAKAAEKGDLKAVKALLAKKKVKVDSRTSDGATALMAAARTGKTDVMKFLLSQRAAVNAKDGEGMTALMHAVKARRKPAVDLLLAKRADVGIRRKDGRNAYDLAAAAKARDLLASIGKRGGKPSTGSGSRGLASGKKSNKKSRR